MRWLLVLVLILVALGAAGSVLLPRRVPTALTLADSRTIVVSLLPQQDMWCECVIRVSRDLNAVCTCRTAI